MPVIFHFVETSTLTTAVGNVHMIPDGGCLNSLLPLARDDCALVYHLESDAFSEPLQRESRGKAELLHPYFFNSNKWR